MNPFVEAILQITAIVVGALIIVFQIAREHRNSLRLQKENIRDEQRLSLYKDLAARLRLASSAIVDLSLLGYHIPSALNLEALQRKQGISHKVTSYRAKDLMEAQLKSGRAIGDVISLLEQNEIISPTFALFRYAITAQLEVAHDIYSNFYSGVIGFLPIEIPSSENSPLRLRAPDDPQQIGALKSLGRKFAHAYIGVGDFINDLSREAQNRLLGDLFGAAVPARKPLDPSMMVISSDPDHVKQLEEKFDLRSKLHPDALPSKIIAGMGAKEEADTMPTLRATAFILDGALIVLSVGYLAMYPITNPHHLMAAGLAVAAPLISSIAIAALGRRSKQERP